MNSNGQSESPSQRQNVNRDPRGRWLSGQAPPGAKLFAPGQSGNPSGSPAGQLYPGRWLGPLSESTDDELRAIMGDPKASRSKRMAARLLLDTDDDDANIRRRAIAEVLDRTGGRPHQAQTIEHKRTRSPHDLLNEARRKLGMNKVMEPTEPNNH